MLKVEEQEISVEQAAAFFDDWLRHETLKMEAVCSSETSVCFHRTTCHYLNCKNLNSYKYSG
jgi:hypothetical protein